MLPIICVYYYYLFNETKINAYHNNKFVLNIFWCTITFSPCTDISTIKQSTQELNQKKATNEIILQDLTNTLKALEKSKDACRTQTNEQETYKRKLLSSIKFVYYNTKYN